MTLPSIELRTVTVFMPRQDGSNDVQDCRPRRNGQPWPRGYQSAEFGIIGIWLVAQLVDLLYTASVLAGSYRHAATQFVMTDDARFSLWKSFAPSSFRRVLTPPVTLLHPFVIDYPGEGSNL